MVSQRLKELRAEHKLTQKMVASVLNISREAYSMYENGKRQLKYDALRTIADYYKVSLDYLFGRIDTPELPSPLSREEYVVLLWYRGLDLAGKNEVFETARQNLADEEVRHLSSD